jgi:hypothetical protein
MVGDLGAVLSAYRERNESHKVLEETAKSSLQ